MHSLRSELVHSHLNNMSCAAVVFIILQNSHLHHGVCHFLTLQPLETLLCIIKETVFKFCSITNFIAFQDFKTVSSTL